MLDINLSRPPAWNVLGAAWRTLEARADGSFFQSWSWVGCRAGARFADPLLLSVRRAGEVVALGLFNRQRRLPAGSRLSLNESGVAALDSIHVEHNGLLVARDAPPDVLVRALADVVRRGGRVTLSGVDAAHLAAARATGALVRERAATTASPWIDLAAVRADPGGHLALVSANSRQQIRRSLRRYAAAGPLRLHRAGALAEAQDFLAALGVLHQQTWVGRGWPGAFANPEFVAFHAELLATAWPRGEIDLLRVDAGGQVLGYLYNFVWRNRVYNYQSGFDYAAAATAHQKPGLTCHHLAAAMYAAEGLAAYDLLAGEQRYKTSLATGSAELHWVEVMPPASLPGLLHRVRAAFAGR
ncbi:MAG: GNAT family N-acetyltransferase [Acetobacteraceae bacterium]|nr:GNAT family N-acetyltransferase [Acetobacteraceae bacterium]